MAGKVRLRSFKTSEGTSYGQILRFINLSEPYTLVRVFSLYSTTLVNQFGNPGGWCELLILVNSDLPSHFILLAHPTTAIPAKHNCTHSRRVFRIYLPNQPTKLIRAPVIKETCYITCTIDEWAFKVTSTGYISMYHREDLEVAHYNAALALRSLVSIYRFEFTRTPGTS